MKKRKKRRRACSRADLQASSSFVTPPLMMAFSFHFLPLFQLARSRAPSRVVFRGAGCCLVASAAVVVVCSPVDSAVARASMTEQKSLTTTTKMCPVRLMRR